MKSSVVYTGNHITDTAYTGLCLEKQSTLKVLAYYDIFQYPLLATEIQTFADQPMAINLVQQALDELMEAGIVFCYQGYYLLQNNPLLIHRRKEGNERAVELLKKANRIGRFLYHFPFVKAIGISGSLSKNFADEKADIDFFIITSANRLWIARTVMHLFKKLTYITRRQHFFCMNYYLDEEALLLNDQNIFTAIELKTVIPVAGSPTMETFFKANTWADTWLPVCNTRSQLLKDPGRLIVKGITEWLLRNRLGIWLDNYCLKVTDRRWRRKQVKGIRNEKGHTMGLITNKHFAYSNPGAFRQKVLAAYREKLDMLHIRE